MGKIVETVRTGKSIVLDPEKGTYSDEAGNPVDAYGNSIPADPPAEESEVTENVD